jgi:hypothetical protein
MTELVEFQSGFRSFAKHAIVAVLQIPGRMRNEHSPIPDRGMPVI